MSSTRQDLFTLVSPHPAQCHTHSEEEGYGNHYGTRYWANPFLVICLFNPKNNPAVLSTIIFPGLHSVEIEVKHLAQGQS